MTPTSRQPIDRTGRPRVGVVLADGAAARLGEVTGGPGVLLRIGGLTIVERGVRMLLASGMERVVVVVGHLSDPVAAAAQRLDPERVQIVRADRREEGTGRSLLAAERAVAGERLFVVLRGDVVFASGSLDALVASSEPAALIDPTPTEEAWAAGTKVRVRDGRAAAFSAELPERAIECGAFVFGQEVFGFQREGAASGDQTLTGTIDRLAATGALMAIAVPPGAMCQRVDSPEHVRQARRMLRRSLIPAGDAPVSRFLYWPISTRLTMALAPLRIPPDAITYVGGLLGLAAAWCLAWGLGLPAAALIQANTILDGVDGETARLQFRSSDRGAVLDAAVDRIVDGSLVAGVALWLWHPLHPSLVFKVGILSSSAYGWGFIAHLFQARMAGFEVSSVERPLVLLLGGRDSRLLVLSIGSAIYQPGLAVATGWLIYLSSVARRMILRKRRPSSQPAVAPSPKQIGHAADRDLHEVG